MGRLVKISFDESLPSEDVILELMNQKTGLRLCLRQGIFALILGTYDKYEDAKFTWVEINMHYEDKQIELTGMRYRVYYLLGTLIDVLIELGGQYNGEKLPWWVGKRWDDLKFKILIPR